MAKLLLRSNYLDIWRRTWTFIGAFIILVFLRQYAVTKASAVV